MTLRILDLYCGAGLVALGLHRAGIQTVGVDIVHQPRYPGPFVKADALSLDMRFIRSFDGIWASPPCLRDTAMRHARGAKGLAHPELITPTRKLLLVSGLPYVMENVETAALIDPVILCGSMFALGAEDDGKAWYLQRHRKFETNWPLAAPSACQHVKPVVGVFGGHARKRAASAGGRGTREGWTKPHGEIMAAAFGLRIDERRIGLTCNEISQGIPPSYAAWVGDRLISHVQQREAA